MQSTLPCPATQNVLERIRKREALMSLVHRAGPGRGAGVLAGRPQAPRVGRACCFVATSVTSLPAAGSAPTTHSITVSGEAKWPNRLA